MTFKELLGKQLIFADGAMGTQLQNAGLAVGEAPMLWSITHPQEVRAVHTAYLQAGATLVTANTFGANALTLKDTPYSVDEVIRAGVCLAREALEQYEEAEQAEAEQQPGEAVPAWQQNNTALQKDDKQQHAHNPKQPSCGGFVALDISPLGELLKPMGTLSFDEAVELFKEQVAAGVAAGVDLILIETMIDTYELKAAVLAAKEASVLPILATVSLSEQGRLLNGADLSCICALLEGLGVDALGLNCGAGPQEMARHVEQMRSLTSLPLVLSPNAGLPQVEEGQVVYRTSPQEFALHMKPLVEEFAAVAGGCCGTTPAHIKALVDACGSIAPKPLRSQNRRVISSYATSIELGAESAESEEEGELRIDTSINTLTNEILAQELAHGNYEGVLDYAFDAVDDNAQIIGVCAISSSLDEAQMLPVLVEIVQSGVKLPLLITSASLAALDKALRIYNGCALVDLSQFEADQVNAAIALSSTYGAVLMKGEGTGA